MLSDGFGDPIAGFANPHQQGRRDTPHLTIGPTPWSFGGSATSSRRAFVVWVPRRFDNCHTWYWDTVFISFFQERRPRPRARPRPLPRRGGGGGDGGGLGLDVRVEVRRTEGRPPPSSFTVVTVLVCVILRIRLPRARC